MKVTIENKKGLEKNIKVLIDKKTIETYMDKKYEEIRKNIVLKGFRPGKVPKEVLEKQFGQAIYNEVLDEVLKETSRKALEEKKIKPAGQPKIDLKSFGKDKELEYEINVTELPKVDIKSLNKINVNEYEVKIEDKETDKRIEEISKSQNNFISRADNEISKDGDMIVFDYNAKINEKEFKGGEGKNAQLILGKDLFIQGFDKKFSNSKKNDKKKFELNLPDSYPHKEFAGQKAMFQCTVKEIKKPEPVKVNDEFAKSLGAKSLEDLKELISKQIKQEYVNSLNNVSRGQILEQLEKIKLEEIPQNLIDQEVSILSQGMKEEDIKKNRNDFEKKARKRIKLGLILNEVGEQNKIIVEDNEIQAEILKQTKMMPGQEKIVMDFYQKNPSAAASLRGTIYEDKIINHIKSQAKTLKKEITKLEAEKIIKDENDKLIKQQQDKNIKKNKESKISAKTKSIPKKTTSSVKNPKKIKKVSKK
tara:strand:+ start:870 stop:2300 length:1431 start_codon:yes stop_codon:yes gene_type:complete